MRAAWLYGLAAWLSGLAACGRFGFGEQAPGDGPIVGTADVRASDAGDITSGLLWWFSLDNVGAHTVQAEVGTAGWKPNLGDTTVVPGRAGNALHFDGVQYSSYVEFPATSSACGTPAPMVTGSITVAAWTRFDSFHDWNSYSLGDFAVGQGTNGGGQGAWGLGATNGCGPFTAGFELSFSEQRAVRCSATTLVAGDWHYLVGTFDASARTIHIYVDGVLDDGAMAPGSPAVGPMTDAADNCGFIGGTSNQQQLMIGTIDEARIYARALTAGDVAALYATY